METFCNVQPDTINKIRIWMTESLMEKPVKFHGNVTMKLETYMTTIYVSSGYCTDIYPENNGG